MRNEQSAERNDLGVSGVGRDTEAFTRISAETWESHLFSAPAEILPMEGW